jgi:hypothetical protein
VGNEGREECCCELDDVVEVVVDDDIEWLEIRDSNGFVCR